MKKFVWAILLLFGTVVGGLAVQHFFWESLNPFLIFGQIFGVLIGYLIIFANRYFFWAVLMVIILALPIVFVGLLSELLALLSIELVGWSLIVLYVIALLIVSTLFIIYGPKYLFKDKTSSKGDPANTWPFIGKLIDPPLDEKSLNHFAWSAAWSFLILNCLIIGALLQPWVPLNDLGLWIGVLMAGTLFWIATMIALELR